MNANEADKYTYFYSHGRYSQTHSLYRLVRAGKATMTVERVDVETLEPPKCGGGRETVQIRSGKVHGYSDVYIYPLREEIGEWQTKELAIRAAEKTAKDERESEAQTRAAMLTAKGKAANPSFGEPLEFAGVDYNGNPTTGWMRTMKVATPLGTPIMMLVKAERKQKWSLEPEFEYSVELAGFVPSYHEQSGHGETRRFTCGDGQDALYDALCEWVGEEIERIERDLAWRAEQAEKEMAS